MVRSGGATVLKTTSLVLLGIARWLLVAASACQVRSNERVVVYTSLDQPISEPVLWEFQKRAGIEV